MNSNSHKLVINDKVVAEGSSKQMRSLRKKQGGRVWLSYSSKVGDTLKREEQDLRKAYTKSEAYDLGYWNCAPPPVCTAQWSRQDWIKYVTFTVAIKTN